ncbi:hypothetical protein I316_03068 [Kwoniella heveanensis BCC8398]|uniref:Integral membrane protein n=1 Tax=Kwoniella heveanensis BCC8398 TaxID=1296120 RepID=A0A1B9GVH2_9TREE|nr:hypothetical protein I316_03068 [Kwoniella heveanensis BCC8398]
MAESEITQAPESVAALWAELGVNSGDAPWFLAVGIILQSFVLQAILSKTIDYFDRSQKRENRWFLTGAGLGTAVALAMIVVICCQARVMIFRDTMDPSSAIRYLFVGDIVHFLFGGIFHLAMGTYYAYRSYEILGRKVWVLPPFGLLLSAQFITSMVAAGNGFKFPHLDESALSTLPDFLHNSSKLFKIWTTITMVVDGIITLFLAVLLFKTNDGIFSRDGKAFKKLLSVIYNTMLPPTICIVAYQISTSLGHSPLVDFRKILNCILPSLYFQTLMYLLVERQTIRKIVDAKLLSSGGGSGPKQIFDPKLELKAVKNGNGHGQGKGQTQGQVGAGGGFGTGTGMGLSPYPSSPNSPVSGKMYADSFLNVKD